MIPLVSKLHYVHEILCILIIVVIVVCVCRSQRSWWRNSWPTSQSCQRSRLRSSITRYTVSGEVGSVREYCCLLCQSCLRSRFCSGVLLSSSSVVSQPCLNPQSTWCQELGGVVQVFRRSPQLVGGWLILQPKLVSLLLPDGTAVEDVVDRLFCFFAIAWCRVYDSNSLHVCSQATVSCLQPA